MKLLAWAAEQGLRFDAGLVGEPTSVERLGDSAKIGRRGSVSCTLTIGAARGTPPIRTGPTTLRIGWWRCWTG